MKKFVKNNMIGFAALIAATAAVDVAWAGVGGDVRKANRLYRQEKYDEALEYYDQALSKRPEDPSIQHNRAAALYRKGEFSEAGEAFLKSLGGGEEYLEERTVYNIGNTEYRIGEGREGSDPSSAMENYKKALEYYKRAMELSPEDQDAKYNYEFTLKKIREIEPQAQQQQQQQQEQQQRQREQQQQQQEQERQREEQRKEEEKAEKPKEEEMSQFQKEKKPATIDELEGEMSEEEAEMLIRGQDEEEARMRAGKKKAGRARPPVLRDW